MRNYLITVFMALAMLASACSPRPAGSFSAAAQAASTSAVPTEEPTQAASPEPAPTEAAAPSAAPQAPSKGHTATISFADSGALGVILVDHNGMPLYMYKGDRQNSDKSACDTVCAQTWPPLISTEAPLGGEGVDASLLGSIKRPSGLLQVTYNGWPLYRHMPDSLLVGPSRGQASGQGSDNKWFAIGQDGSPVSTLLPAPAAAQ
jgi:predicted lipoprotein with Yx(FWY)xxD motif